MTEKRPLILITNDDGYEAQGISLLVETLKDLGEIIVFAPDRPRSGMSCAITSDTPLYSKLVKKKNNIPWHVCNGTPVDCVKLALNEFLDRKPDLVVSGINHGSNAGISVLYSGTVGAAIEGCIFNIPSVAVSLCNHQSNPDFSTACCIAHKVAGKVLEEGLPRGVCLNVNIPEGEVKGVKITTQTQGKWVNEYYKMQDETGREIFRMTGNFENWEGDNHNTDEWALANGYAAIVPVKIDMTAHDFIPHLQKWEFQKTCSQ